MTIANFKQQVANFMNRSLASLTADNAQDMILVAMNDARRGAQRAHDFELLATEDAYLSTHFGGAAWTTACKTTPGGATAIQLKRVDSVWGYSTKTIGASTYYPRTNPIPFDSRSRFRRELSALNNTLAVSVSTQSSTISDTFAYAVGSNLYINNVNTATIYKLVGIQWLDDLSGSESPDIFLTYFTDWFRYATVAAMNVYLKDDEQFPIRASVMNTLWESVKTHDGVIANMGESSDLA